MVFSFLEILTLQPDDCQKVRDGSVPRTDPAVKQWIHISLFGLPL